MIVHQGAAPGNGAGSGNFARLPLAIAADRRLSPADKLVAAALASFDFKYIGRCWPSIPSIMARVGLGRRSVQLGLRNLEHHGRVRVEPNGSIPTGREYVLLWVTGEAAETSAGPSPRKRVNDRVQACRMSCMDGGVQTPQPVGAEAQTLLGAGAQTLLGAGAQTPHPELEKQEEKKIDRSSFVPLRGGGREDPRAGSEAQALCLKAGDDWDDPRARAFHGGVVKDVGARRLSEHAVVYALECAVGKGVRNPGAAFNAAIGRCRTHGGSVPRPGPSAPPAAIRKTVPPVPPPITPAPRRPAAPAGPPAAPAPQTSPPAPAPPGPLTEGQRDFTARLDPRRRAAFEAKPSRWRDLAIGWYNAGGPRRALVMDELARVSDKLSDRTGGWVGAPPPSAASGSA